MNVVFASKAWDDYCAWEDRDPKIFLKLKELIKECRRHPFEGTGKPEPLKGELKGHWSRRITLEHRLVYRVEGKGTNQCPTIVQCGGHYDD